MKELKCPHIDCENNKFDTERAMKIHYSLSHKGSLAKNQTVCSTEGCNNEFEYYPSDKEGIFCQKCVKDKNGHITQEKTEYHRVQCELCECEREITDSRFKEYDIYFCGEKCRDEYFSNTKIIECDGCQEEKPIPAWRIEHGGDNIYCNRQCYLEQHKQCDGNFSNNYYGASFEDIRSKVRKRDNFVCQVCGDGKESNGSIPSAHHITPVRWFYNHKKFCLDDANHMSNMVLLCRHHHTLADYDKINLQEELDDELVDKLEFEKPTGMGS